MAAKPHPGDLTGLDEVRIKEKILSFMTDHGVDRSRVVRRRERMINRLMSGG